MLKDMKLNMTFFKSVLDGGITKAQFSRLENFTDSLASNVQLDELKAVVAGKSTIDQFREL